MQEIAGRNALLLVRHRNHTGMDSSVLTRGARRGDLIQLRSGAFVKAAVWKALTPDERVRLEVAAAAAVHRGPFVASHRSAAAHWGIPRIKKHDGLVHQRATSTAGSRTEHRVRQHAVADFALHLTRIAGITVTDVDRTVLDLAASEPFSAAVTVADWALRSHTTKDRLRAALDEWGPTRGRRRIERVIDFGNGESQSAGESVSRVQIFEGGLTMPILQQRFDDGRGLIGGVDFSWPEFNLIGAFDGLVKFRKPEFMKGRTDSEVLTDEKDREDRLRDTPEHPHVTRWVWGTLSPVGQLETQLRRAGVR